MLALGWSGMMPSQFLVRQFNISQNEYMYIKYNTYSPHGIYYGRNAIFCVQNLGIIDLSKICCSYVRFGVSLFGPLRLPGRPARSKHQFQYLCDLWNGGYQSLDVTTCEWHPQTHEPTCVLFCEGKWQPWVRFVKGKGSDNCCYMQYKHCNHNQWEPKDSPGIQLLQVNGAFFLDKHVVHTCHAKQV